MVADARLRIPRGWQRASPRKTSHDDESPMGTQRLTIALVFALMLASGFLGLHLADQAANRWPDPHPQPLVMRR